MRSGSFAWLAGSVGARAGAIALALAAFNLLAWGWAFAAFRDHPLLLGTALLAYGFGLRHAVDADHIAAIDNVTRKLMGEGQRPVAVGLYFSLGHSTVVVALSVGLVLATTLLQDRFDDLKAVGGVVGTSISALFLFAIAACNLATLGGIWRGLRMARRGQPPSDADFDGLAAGGGAMSRVFRRVFRLIGHSWQMYPLGLLFGLGFDTATEIGVLGISAVGASQGLSLWSILVFPALFSAGMALVDAADGILMLGAYGWAEIDPTRKLAYNLAVTLVSVLAAVFTGIVEVLGLVAGRTGAAGPLWEAVGAVNDHMGMIGAAIIGVSALAWLTSLALWRSKPAAG